MPRRLLALGALMALLLLSPAAAQAQASPAEQARNLARQGTARYQVGLFDEALRLYEAAYKLYPLPALIFNIAQCHRQLKNYEKAVFLYRSFLRAQPSAPNRAQVEEIIRDLDRLVAEQRRAGNAPPDSNLHVEGRGATSSSAATAPRPATGSDDADTGYRPWYRRWYVWAIVGAVVVGGAVGGAVAATRGGGSPEPVPMGTLGNMSFGFGGQR